METIKLTPKKALIKEINRLVASKDITGLFALAKKQGFGTIKKNSFMRIAYFFRPLLCQRDEKLMFRFLNEKDIEKSKRVHRVTRPFNLKIRVIEKAKYHVKNTIGTSYFKTLHQGNNNIYWAGVFGHKDYNKSIAMPNTQENWEFCKKINKVLNLQHYKKENV